LPVTLRATVSDSIGVESVGFIIANAALTQYWNGTAWQAGVFVNDASLAAAQWEYVFNPGASATYNYKVRAFDALGKQADSVDWHTIKVRAVDLAGNSTYTPEISVMVNNSTSLVFSASGIHGGGFQNALAIDPFTSEILVGADTAGFHASIGDVLFTPSNLGI